MSVLLWLLAGILLIVVGLALFSARVAWRAEKAVPACGQFIEVNGARIHYLDQGQGPVIVMIHGLGGQLQNFSHSLLEHLTGEFRIILVDRPGSGYSARLRGASAGLRAQGDTMAAFLRALDLDRPLLVGHSLGGAVALAVVLDHPQCIGALGLIAPLTHPPRMVPAPVLRLALRSKVLRWAAAWTIAVPLSLLKGPEMLASVFSPDTPPDDFAVAGGGQLGLRPWTVFATFSDMVAVNEDLPEMVQRYGTLRMPVAVLFGWDDRVLDRREHGATMEAKVPDLDLTVVPGGHMLPITAPDRTAEWVRDVAPREGKRPQVTDA